MATAPSSNSVHDDFVLVNNDDEENEEGMNSNQTNNQGKQVQDSDSDSQDFELWFSLPDSVLSSSDQEVNVFPYHPQAIQSIFDSRNQLHHGQLFIDRLLELAGILSKPSASTTSSSSSSSPSSRYPPTSLPAIFELLSNIKSSNFDSNKQKALVYYLLLDFGSRFTLNNPSLSQDATKDAFGNNGRKQAERFAKATLLPQNLRKAMLGYWLCDVGRFEESLPYLTTEFSSKLTSIFLPSSIFDSSDLDLLKLRTTVFYNYLQSHQPPISTDEEKEARVLSVCWNLGVREAWKLVESQPFDFDLEGNIEYGLRSRLEQRVWRFCFSPSPNPAAIKTLVSLPMSEASSIHLQAFILSSPTNFSSISTSTACDFLLVRLISNGQFLDAVRLSRKLDDIGESGIGSKIDEENLTIEQRELNNNLKRKLREKRRLLLDGALKVLPHIELELLRAELDFANNQDASLSASEGKETEVDGMGMSWENVVSKNQPINTSTPVKSKASKPIGFESLPLSASPSRSKSASPAQNRKASNSSPSNNSIANHETLLHSVLRATRGNAEKSRQISSPLRPRGSDLSAPLAPRLNTASASQAENNAEVNVNENNGDVSMMSGDASTLNQSQSAPQDQEPSSSSSRFDSIAAANNQPIGFLARNNLSMGSSIARSPFNQQFTNEENRGDVSSDSLRKFKSHPGSSNAPRNFNSPMAAAGRSPSDSSFSLGFGTLKSQSKASPSSAFALPVRRYEAKYTGPSPNNQRKRQNRNPLPTTGDISIGDGLQRMEFEMGGGDEGQDQVEPQSAASNTKSQALSRTRKDGVQEPAPSGASKKPYATASSTPIKSRSGRLIKTQVQSSETPTASTPKVRTRSQESSDRIERSTSSVPGGFPGMEELVDHEIERDGGVDERKDGDADETMDELDLLSPPPASSTRNSKLKKSASASSSKPKVSSRLKSVTASSRSNDHFTLEIPVSTSTTSRSRKTKNSTDGSQVGESNQDEEIGEIPKRRGGSRKTKNPIKTTDEAPELPVSSSSSNLTGTRGRSKRSTRANSVSASSVSESQGDEDEDDVKEGGSTQRRSGRTISETSKRQTARSRSTRSGLDLGEDEDMEVDKTPGVRTRSGKRTMRG